MSSIATFLSSEGEESELSDQHDEIDDQQQVNYLQVAWHGAPPTIYGKGHGNASDEVSSSNIRKILFCRDLSDRVKRKSLKAWDIPLTWQESDVKTVFSIFGEIRHVHFSQHNNITGRHCCIRFEDASNVEFAMKYESASMVQPMVEGSVSLGMHKYLSNYIRTRPLNVHEMQLDVDNFMLAYDKLQRKKQEKIKNQPRRNRGWIQRRGKDGFTTIHYPNKFERKKHRSVRMNPKDDVNPEPVRQMYDTRKKKAYYKSNEIRDSHAVREKRLFKKRKLTKDMIKQKLKAQSTSQIKHRLSTGSSRLQKSMSDRQRWDKDMGQTTQLRKQRNFKPL